ncbi:MAG: HEPN domain-containing protein [Acetobacteraceae bacterium]|nr:HEPN domain-containing protein [Acetobacteraceae bacterium]
MPAYLRSAHAVAASGGWEQVTSLAHYATFHAALALLATAGIGAETHAGVQQAFSLHFVKEGPLPRGSAASSAC